VGEQARGWRFSSLYGISVFLGDTGTINLRARIITMAGRCDICGKEKLYGQNVSHANNKTKRVFRANLKLVRGRVQGRVANYKVCTRCIKAFKIEKL
jgi:large subunit ribosomal protein L28